MLAAIPGPRSGEPGIQKCGAQVRKRAPAFALTRAPE